MIYREIQSTDNVSVAKMIRNVFCEFDAPKTGTVYSDPTTDDLYQLFTKEKACLFVAEQAGEIVGSCGVYPTKGLAADTFEIVKFYVADSVRGTGVGRKLYQMSEEYARSIGVKHLYIESTPAFQNAVRLYHKIGYISLKAPLGDSGHSGCDIWMRKTI